MPFKYRKLPHSNKVRVYNPKNHHITAKRISIEKAKKQIKLLNRKSHDKYI